MATTTTATKLKSLTEMARMTGRQLYIRIKLASEILEDQQYIDAKHRGDEFRCATFLEEEFFPDLGGAYSLVELVGMFRAFPNEPEWAEVKYNLRAMYTLYSRQRRRTSTPERTEPPRQRAAADPLASPSGPEVDELRQLRERNAELAAECARLREENALLKAALERKSERQGEEPAEEALAAASASPGENHGC